MRQLADNAIAAIERKEVTFTPENKGDVVIKYLKDIKDWNISRQIPWGIPIPMFQSKTNLDDWRYSTEVDKKEIVVDGTTYRREEDTLDTWFSSGQWPYITTDYLDAGKLAKYYPNTVMETAGDILFAWVARMIMLGLYRTGQVPFKHVYLHGLAGRDLPASGGHDHCSQAGGHSVLPPGLRSRSEERRVGKECRSRWSPYH